MLSKTTALVALTAGLTITGGSIPASADSSCSSTYFCVWDAPHYGGIAARTTVAVPEWHQAQGNWPTLTWNDRSYKNRFTPLAWVCVYISKYSGPTVWVASGDSISYPPSGMTAAMGDAHRGRSAGQSC
ncbi:peptidase inhibitor family I36 protein [Streptosporangium saharense]|uniref:peptidase inhibitor family I36 protein n=1 Tax=Streptosporangium saharense TaxID=1706840 RepID=UPI00331B88F7